jgi:hypothetical protein
MTKIKIKRIKRTCWGCPAQWEGRTTDNRPIYIRYRWGTLRVDIGKKGQTISEAILSGKTALRLTVGDNLSGCMEDEELMEITKNKLEFPSGFGKSRTVKL